MHLTRTLAKRARALVLALACLAALGAAPARAATTYYVAPNGSDGNPGSQGAPFATIGKAAGIARSGDVVMVASGTYNEEVALNANSGGVTLKGYGDTQPVIDGGGVRQWGIKSPNTSAPRVAVSNFEIKGQTDGGIWLAGDGVSVTGNTIHDIGKPGVVYSNGVQIGYGKDATVSGNRIYSIGPGGESFGVRLLNSRTSTVSDNDIQLVRKEGVRDWMGLDNVIADNRISLCWTGIAYNTSTGTVASNNYLHDNTVGFNPKHVSSSDVLIYWHVTPHWSRFWHNTVYRSSQSAVWIATNAPNADYIDVRDNVFSGAGSAFVEDAPSARGTHIQVDGNVYSNLGGDPPWLYHTGFDYSTGGQTTIAGMRSSLGWEKNGSEETPGVGDPGAPTPPASAFTHGGGVNVGDARGTQVGADALRAEPNVWIPRPMTPVQATSVAAPSIAQLASASDDRQHTYWVTPTPANQSVTFDLGSSQVFSDAVLDLHAHLDKRNPHGYKFDVSDDGQQFTAALSGQNPDDEGSSYKYAFGTPLQARYLRFTMVDPFCDSFNPPSGCASSMILSDLRLGYLQPVLPPEPTLNDVLSLPGGAGGGPGPKLSQVRLDHRTFRVSGTSTPLIARLSHGSRLRYRISKPATVLIAVERYKRRYARWSPVVVLARTHGHRGAFSTRFTGHVEGNTPGGKPVDVTLKPGHFRLTLVAFDANRLRSNVARRMFKVAR